MEKAVKKVASWWSTHGKKLDDITPDETPEVTPQVGGADDVNEIEVKPLVVQKELPKTKDGDLKVAVEIEKLVIFPATYKLPTARRGKPFDRGNPPGCKRAVPVPVKRKSDDVNTEDIVDDASVEVDDTSYEMWLASEGLVSPKPNIRKINEAENKQDVKEHEDDKPVPKKVDEISAKSGEKENLAQIKSKVKGMISHGQEVELSEAKLNRLKAILSLLDEDDEEKKQDEICKKQEEEKKKAEEEAQRKKQEAIDEENKKAQEALLQKAAEEENKLKKEKDLEDEKLRKIKENKEIKDADQVTKDVNEDKSNDIKEKPDNGNTDKSEENPKEKIGALIFTKSIIRKKSEDQVKQSDGTNDCIQSHALSVVVESDDSSSDKLVIADENITENKNAKRVTFLENVTVTDNSMEMEDTVDIDTTLDINTTLDTCGDTTPSTVETAETPGTTDTVEYPDDEDHYAFPLSQNVDKHRHLIYKPEHDRKEEENVEEDREEDEDGVQEGEAEEEADDVDTR